MSDTLLEISAEKIRIAVVSTENDLYSILGSIEMGNSTDVYIKEEGKEGGNPDDSSGFLNFRDLHELVTMLENRKPNIMFVSPYAFNSDDITELFDYAVSRNIMIRVSDDLDHSNFSLPAVLHRGSIEVGVSTHGKSPLIACEIRDRVKKIVTEKDALSVLVQENIRTMLRKSNLSFDERKRVMQSVLRDSGIGKMIGENDIEKAIESARSMVSRYIMEKNLCVA